MAAAAATVVREGNLAAVPSTKAAKAKRPRPERTAYVGDGGARLVVTTRQRTDGWLTFVEHRASKDAEVKAGMYVLHATADAAKAAHEAHGKAALKDGWKPAPAAAGGRVVPPSDFSAIPKPGKK